MRRRNVFRGQSLNAFGVLEDVAQLAAVFVQFVRGQRDARQRGHLGDINVDGHGVDGTREPEPPTGPQRPRGIGTLRVMLPIPSRSILVRRVPRVFVGLVFLGLGIAFMVVSELGVAPWVVFHQGISIHTGVPLGTVGIITGALALLGWIPLHERVGIGTLMNVTIIGVVIDVSMLPDQAGSTGWRWVALLGGIALVGVGSGLYIGAGLGPGPRDGLMTGLARRGYRMRWARTAVELTVLVAGWLLGGTVGIGTVLFALGVGPAVEYSFRRMAVVPIQAET